MAEKNTETNLVLFIFLRRWGVGGKLASESFLRSAWTLLSLVRDPPPAPRQDEGPESLRSPSRGLAIFKKICLKSFHSNS
ncbi:hypothetical protein PoB_005486400 [Plakobranchus ocellatus]|uniref:Uncharacterized protein n=1 Tax=Plakobranchus ocellatus TaxID=259542 RepID=A0AAV4CBA4_9GAST|nr:hypothetical protein PoB_005486400 [Plakobranchus ocellatus]